MSDKKAILAATVVLLTVFGAPVAASAAPVQTGSAQSGISIHTEDHDDESDDGDDDEDDGDDRHGYIPPVFVVPGQKKPHNEHKTKPSGTVTTTPSTGSSSSTAGIDPLSGDPVNQIGPDGQPMAGTPGSDLGPAGTPEESRAVDITRVPKHMKSPADAFMDTAYIGLGLLGVSAVGLGVTAGVRAIRLRRSGKSDYIYNDK